MADVFKYSNQPSGGARPYFADDGSTPWVFGRPRSKEQDAGHELERLRHRREVLIAGALGPERKVILDRYSHALTLTAAELAAAGREVSRDRDIALGGLHGDDEHAQRCVRDAARYLYDAGKAEALEQLAGVVAGRRGWHDLAQLVALEMRHCGRPFSGTACFERSRLPRGPQLDPPAIAEG